jgi:hypothetical protein
MYASRIVMEEKQHSVVNNGALHEPRYQKLIRYGRINIEGEESNFAVVAITTKSGAVVYEVMQRVGMLRTNDRKREGEGFRDPDARGFIKVNNVDWRISTWKKMSKNGNDFTSVAVVPSQIEQREGNPTDDDMPDEQIPF